MVVHPKVTTVQQHDLCLFFEKTLSQISSFFTFVTDLDSKSVCRTSKMVLVEDCLHQKFIVAGPAFHKDFIRKRGRDSSRTYML